MSEAREFPIMGCKTLLSVPWAMLEPHEEQAMRNHGQTLKRLAQRGGLCVSEAIDILQGHRWNTAANCPENDAWLIEKARQWRAAKEPS